MKVWPDARMYDDVQGGRCLSHLRGWWMCPNARAAGPGEQRRAAPPCGRGAVSSGVAHKQPVSVGVVVGATASVARAGEGTPKPLSRDPLMLAYDRLGVPCRPVSVRLDQPLPAGDDSGDSASTAGNRRTQHPAQVSFFAGRGRKAYTRPRTRLPTVSVSLRAFGVTAVCSHHPLTLSCASQGPQPPDLHLPRWATITSSKGCRAPS